MPPAGGELSKPWDWRPTDCDAEHNRSASTSWRARTGRAGRAPHIGRFVSASVDRAGGDRESVSGAPEGSFSKNPSVVLIVCAHEHISRFEAMRPRFNNPRCSKPPSAETSALRRSSCAATNR